MDLAIIGVEHAELHIVHLHDLIALGQMPEFLHEYTTEGVEIFIAEFFVKEIVEVFDGGKSSEYLRHKSQLQMQNYATE